MKRKILVVEDEENIREGLIDALGMEGYEVKGVADGREALKYYTQWEPELLLLDIMMPHKSGYDICREIRRGNPHIPIIMLTAKGEEIDKVLGLELGADDYITKPFGLRELAARISAVLRRAYPSEEPRKENFTELSEIKFGDVQIDIKTMRGKKGKEEFELSRREIDMLLYFTKHKSEVLDRYNLMMAVWGSEHRGFSRTLDQHIVQLRKKIEDDPKNPEYIKTVYGIGYRFDA
ncbi:MAG: DNA-binding response regulator [Lentisphaerae bacterium GWF2_44_16]|nr:MAG: DNA-binding response regulator [Lentisphaerae bacterium GWF2_44_16]